MKNLTEFVPPAILDNLDIRSLINEPLERLRDVRLMQDTADRAYERGEALIREGRLKIKISKEIALGNYVDAQVRAALRKPYERLDIDSSGKRPIRVNRREEETIGDERAYRRPDARVGSIALDVTLSKKTILTPQIQGFFRSDFKPEVAIIIRPRQLGDFSRYAIKRPEKKHGQ